jgi:hypothetical protein
MSEEAFSVTAGIFFLLIAVGHALRIVFHVPVVVEGFAVPVWASGIAIVVTGLLSYEGFRVARHSGSKK